MLGELKRIVYEANIELPRRGLITCTWRNVSGIDKEKGLSVIRPSDVDYNKLKPSQMVVVDLEGNKVGSDMNPSSDATTHMEPYKAFKNIDGIVHAHSPHATAWVQTRKVLSCYEITHADYFYGEIPCARNLTEEEIEKGYEMNTGKVIMETFTSENPVYVPTVLCKNHGPFTQEKDTARAMHNAMVLEEVVKVNYITGIPNPQMRPIPQCMLDKHFMREYGPNVCYGQRNR